MKKIALFLCFIYITTQIINTNAQQWEKTSLNSNYIQIVKTTPWGILAGEFDTRLWKNPFNGIYISQNLGKSWQQLALPNKGITDIAYDVASENIYASAYYLNNEKAGLYASSDSGITWNSFPLNFSINKVAADNETILAGAYSHGLWYSKDFGQTWVQKIGNGFFGPKIENIYINNETILVATENESYISIDKGETWNLMELSNIKTFEYLNETIFAATNSTLYKSTDFGSSWEKILDNIAGDIVAYQKSLYASVKHEGKLHPTLVVSVNNGSTWENTNLELTSNSTKINSLDWLYSNPNYIFTNISNLGVYKYTIPNKQLDTFKFLRIPWNYENENELIYKITAFFDHRYPFLSHYSFTEPYEYKNSTMNFYGQEKEIPEAYYSSHDGMDYALPYGTPILAAASGTATYHYSAKGLGHHIKIDHANGYQTTYAHLQKNSLITNTQIEVEQGETIGLVGMTGNTSGPHLHFEIAKDTNLNGNFDDDKPFSRFDPYGWQNFEIIDPWQIYKTANKTGIKSQYVWNTNDYPEGNTYFEYKPTELNLDNIKLEIPQTVKDENITFTIIPSQIPGAKSFTQTLKYIHNTAFKANAKNNINTNMQSFEDNIKISIKLDPNNLLNINKDTLALYFFNENTKKWEKLNSVFNTENNTLNSETNHFSNFAVFAEKIDYTLPLSEININGVQIDFWFEEQVEITINSNDESGIKYIFYSLDNETSWQEYTNPIIVDKTGITEFKYRAQDINDNLESVKSAIIKIKSENQKISKIKIKDTTFNAAL